MRDDKHDQGKKSVPVPSNIGLAYDDTEAQSTKKVY